MNQAPFSVAVIGGGLAGLAAAEAACRHGLQVEIFEQLAMLGGRAGSFVEPFNQRMVDFGQHAAMGCCTNFLDFCRRCGVADCFCREKKFHFIGPDNRLREFSPSRWLPAPFHFLFRLKKLDFLATTERCGLVIALKKLVKIQTTNANNPGTTFGDWLRRQNQSENAIKLFWQVIIQSALGETIENVSLAAARKVFADGFVASRTAGEMILANRPQAEIFDRRIGQWLSDCNVAIHRRTRVMWIEMDENSQLSLVLPEGDVRPFDAVILAVPWYQARSLFTPSMLEELPSLAGSQNLCSGGIAAVHLWFDRPITPLPHAILVGKTAQWIFQSPSGRNELGLDVENEEAFFYQVVISATHRLVEISRESLLNRVLAEIAEAFPGVRSAQLLHSRLVQQPQAIFTMSLGAEKDRPSQKTSINNLLLAGDWTDTGWPATMESAVRSGYLAIEYLLKMMEREAKILVPEQPKGFFAKKILGV